MRIQKGLAALPVRLLDVYLRSVIDQVEVDDAEIRIHGRRDVLERLVMGGGATPAGVPFVNGAPDRMKLGTAMSLLRLLISNHFSFSPGGPLCDIRR